MRLGVDQPAVLWFLFLAVLPIITSIFRARGVPSLVSIPRDALSAAIAVGLRTLAALAITATVLGLAGLHRREGLVSRAGHGAHLVLLLDRSSSMDNSFAGRQPGKAEESKSAAAKRLLTDFVARRPHDRIAVAAFSTSPMPVLPMSEHLEAVRAAVAAMDRPGLAFTDVGRGLALGLSLFDETSFEASRALLLVSDGAAVIDRRVQLALRDAVKRTPVHLYWLYLRSAGAPGVFDPPGAGGEGTPQTNPERHLHQFLTSLGVPYKAFEATSPEAVREAIAAIDRLETKPLHYFERVPRRDLARAAYAIAAAATGFLLLAKFLERDLTSPSRAGVQQGPATTLVRPT
jgi:mxaC protein